MLNHFHCITCYTRGRLPSSTAAAASTGAPDLATLFALRAANSGPRMTAAATGEGVDALLLLPGKEEPPGSEEPLAASGKARLLGSRLQAWGRREKSKHSEHARNNKANDNGYAPARVVGCEHVASA
jgi:hypothetical protein